MKWLLAAGKPAYPLVNLYVTAVFLCDCAEEPTAEGKTFISVTFPRQSALQSVD